MKITPLLLVIGSTGCMAPDESGDQLAAVVSQVTARDFRFHVAPDADTGDGFALAKGDDPGTDCGGRAAGAHIVSSRGDRTRTLCLRPERRGRRPQRGTDADAGRPAGPGLGQDADDVVARARRRRRRSAQLDAGQRRDRRHDSVLHVHGDLPASVIKMVSPGSYNMIFQ